MSEVTPEQVNIEQFKSVLIEDTNKDKFLSKTAVKRFKDTLKKCDVKNIVIEDGNFLDKDYVFDIKYKDNIFNVKIIPLVDHMKNEKRKMLRKKLRNAEYSRSSKAKKDIDSMRRSIPDKLFKSYMNLMKQYNFSNIPSPKDVINDPEKFKRQIGLMMGKTGMVSNNENANNALKKYFNTLGNFMGVDPMDINIKQSEQPILNNDNDEDTEDEDEPNLV